MLYCKQSLNSWDLIYKNGLQLNLWPFSNLVGIFKRFERFNLSGLTSILELGCGAGANSQIFINSNYSYLGVDCSQIAIDFALQKYRFSNLQFLTQNLEFYKPVKKNGIVFDRAALTHLNMSQLEKVKKNILTSIEPGGLYIGVDWFSMDHPDRKYSRKRIDKYTYSGFTSGQFVKIDQVQFFDTNRIKQLMLESEMELLYFDLQEKVNKLSKNNEIFNSQYSFVARKIE
jgi:cyclopropane fatty-acyl-phospholipid synthase-like methyltransferase